jgi:sugar lactone lactonase YvrE
MTTAESAAAQPARSPRLYALEVVPGGVHRIDPDDGTVTDIALGVTEAPDGIVVDETEGYAYITLMGTPDTPPQPGTEPPFTHRNGSVQRVPLSGGAPQIVVPRGTFTTGKQLTTDPATGRLYWCDREGRGVYRAERDGSGLTALVLTAGHGPTRAEEECVGIAVDTAHGWLYWTQKGPSDGGRGRILRARLELPAGTPPDDRDDIETLWDGLPEPIDLELDPNGQVLYWTDRGAGPLGNTLNRAPVPPSGRRGDPPTIIAGDFHEAIGLAVDHANGSAYVSDLSGAVYEITLADGNKWLVTKFPGPATGLALVR